MIYSGVVLVSGYKFVYGEAGFMTKLLVQLFPSFNTAWFHGYWAVLFVMTFACTSNHFLFLSNAIRKIDYQTVEAARNMGASTWYILRRVVLPVLKPTIYALTILTFLTGLAATSAPLILGEGIPDDYADDSDILEKYDLKRFGCAVSPYTRSGHTGVVDRDDPVRT